MIGWLHDWTELTDYRSSSFTHTAPPLSRAASTQTAGDFVFGNGSGGESVFGTKGGKFKDDRGGLALKHDCAGVLSMGNSGKHSNTSQFFLTLGPAPQCDGKHVVFGRVVSGGAVLRYIEAVAGSADGEPRKTVRITACGAWQAPSISSGSGDGGSGTGDDGGTSGGGSGGGGGQGFWLDVPDGEAHAGFVPRFFARPRVGVAAPSPAAAERFVAAVGAAWTKANPGSAAKAVGEGRGPVVSPMVVAVAGGGAGGAAGESSGGSGCEGGEGGAAGEGGLSSSPPPPWEELVRRHRVAFDLLIVAPACAEAVEALLRADYPGGDWSSNGHVAVCKPNPAAIAPHLERYAG